MVAKKPAAKKTVAKKTTAAPAKKVAAKKTAAKKGSASEGGGVMDTINLIAAAIVNGDLDAGIIPLDDAITKRINAVAAERQKAEANKRKVADDKKVSTPPKKSEPEPDEEDDAPKGTPVKTPEEGKTYVIADRLKSLAGAKVKFLRFKADDDKKAVVEMLTDVAGNPKGKRVGVPIAALLVPPATKKPARRAVKKK
jgi:hypothetical protein